MVDVPVPEAWVGCDSGGCKEGEQGSVILVALLSSKPGREVGYLMESDRKQELRRMYV